MNNTKEEFIEDTKGLKVLCARIVKGDSTYQDEDECKTYILKQGYTKEEYNIFLESLNFTYDDGYGGQELFGIIWCEDSTWLSRGEYDGSEWWEVNKYPEISNDMKR